jgi:hypothetical protein
VTRAEAETRGWRIWRQDREPRWFGDDELERWFAERSPGPVRQIAGGPIELLLEMVAGWERLQASGGLRPAVPGEAPQTTETRPMPAMPPSRRLARPRLDHTSGAHMVSGLRA